MDIVLLGKQIQTYRIQKGLTQGRLAMIAGISEKHLSKIELGKINLRVDTLVKLVNALDISVNRLLGDFIDNRGDADLMEICKCVSELSHEEKARLLWHLQMEREFDYRKDEQQFFLIEEE